MRAADVMVQDVVSVGPDADVADAVQLLIRHDISALPVIQDGRLVGILSEADLMQREEIGTQPAQGWMESLIGAASLADQFTRSHGKKIGEVMTTEVISVSEDTPLSDIASLFERRRIKRVPVVSDGRLVGIVSRANLIQALAAALQLQDHPDADRQIRQELLSRLAQQQWTGFGERNVTVKDGVVHLWGLVGSVAEHRALVALAEGLPGVLRVADETIQGY